jgi:hypothetical protein
VIFHRNFVFNNNVWIQIRTFFRPKPTDSYGFGYRTLTFNFALSIIVVLGISSTGTNPATAGGGGHDPGTSYTGCPGFLCSATDTGIQLPVAFFISRNYTRFLSY